MKWREKGTRLYRKFVLGEHVEDLNHGGDMSAEAMKYPQSALEAFGQGVRLDLRARLAVDFLKTPMAAEYARYGFVELKMAPAMVPEMVAKFALDTAEQVILQAEERGWTAPLPDHADLNAQEKHQARRNAKFNVEGQLAGQRYMQEVAAGAIATPNGPRMPS